MAARDAQFYNYLKKALKNKLRYPEASSFRSGNYFFDYDYIFQQARRVLPQKYSIGHSYWQHDNQRIAISYLNKQQLNELNLEFARDVVEQWGGMDEKQAEAKYLDPVLAEYENELTAPEEPDSFHNELEQNQLPPETEKLTETPISEQPETHSQPTPPHLEQPHRSQPPPPPQKPPAFTKQTEEKLNKANQSIQETKSKLAGPEEVKPQLSDKMSQRLNSATRSMRRPPLQRTPPQPSSPTNPGTTLNSRNRRKALASLLKGRAGSGLGIPPWLSRSAWNMARGAARLAWNIGSSLGRAAINALTRAAAQLLPRLGAQAGLAAARAGIGLAAPAIVAAAPLFLFYGLIIGVFLIGWWYSSQFNDINCDKPGKMEVKKVLENPRSGIDNVGNGDRIDYQIQIHYIWLCDNINLPTVTITDIVPRSLEYVPGSAKSESPAFAAIGTPLPEGTYNEATRVITWTLTNVSSNDVYAVYFSAKPFMQQDGSWSVQDAWLQNQATVTYQAPTSKSSGGFSDITGLLPSPLTPAPANWEDVKALVVAAYNKHPELINMYKQASAETGVPWQVLAGLHFVETGSGPGPDSSLVSGRKLGQVEPDVSPVKCANGVSGPGKPIPLGGGCGFSSQLDSAIYAGYHLAEKIGKVPSTFPEAVEAMSKYNGGGNANCDEGLDYGPCPPQFYGEDDPYAMADFDESHSSKKMYVIFCADFTRCNPKRIFDRPGAMGVVRALIEEGL